MFCTHNSAKKSFKFYLWLPFIDETFSIPRFWRSLSTIKYFKLLQDDVKMIKKIVKVKEGWKKKRKWNKKNTKIKMKLV